jgi:small subunit ribosomal protein S15
MAADSTEKTQKSEIIRKAAKHQGDTGSAQVQVAILTERIRHLTQHLKTAPKDFSTRRGLLKMVGRRSSLLRYLARTDASSYQALVGRLGIRR